MDRRSKLFSVKFTKPQELPPSLIDIVFSDVFHVSVYPDGVTPPFNT